MDQIKQQLRAYIAEEILFSRNGFNYEDDASFLETGIIDSMSIMEVVLFAQDRFSVTIEDKEIVPDNFDSIQKIAEFLERKIEEPSSGQS